MVRTGHISRRGFLAAAGFAGLALAFARPSFADEVEFATVDPKAFDEVLASGPVADDAAIAASEWATKVKEAGKLRVGGVRTSALFSLEDVENGGIRGFDAGLLQLLARYVLGDASAFELTQVTSDTRESVLQNDQVDCVFATYSITPKRAEIISFAGPYYTSQQGILVTIDNDYVTGVDDLNGLVVAAQSGSTGPEIVEEYAPDASGEEYSTDEEAITALERGRVYAYVIDITLHLGNVLRNPDKYKIVGEQFGPIDPYGIGLPLDSDGVSFVNDFLVKIEQEGIWSKLWQVTIGDRTGVAKAPKPPAIAGAEAEAESGDAAAAGAFKDGVYEATGKGIGGNVPLTVTIEGGKIVSVEVGENGETQGIGSKAIEQLPALIVEAQGIDGVDGVSGASVTSKAIFTAMAEILEQAKA